MTSRLIIAVITGLGIMGLGLLATGANAASQPQAMGTWINPPGSVKVQTANCGNIMCGWVVWASGKAMADARASGVTRLVGLQLLRNYHSTGLGRYEGRVYVPDMGRTFQSFIEQRGANSLRISGCILGGLLCKSQDWRRA